MKRLICALAGIGIFFVQAQTAGEEYEVDITKKTQDCRELVVKAVNFLNDHPIAESCRAFANETVWRKGEVCVFLFDDGGVCYVFGADQNVVWKDFYDEKTLSYEAFIPSMLKIGEQGGSVDFRWRNANMQAYVQRIEKDGKTYIVGAGFYPSSDRYVAEQLVSGAAKVGAALGSKKLFEDINSPLGPFRQGDVFLYALDMDGEVVAHGQSLELLGQNLSDEKSEDGKFITKDIFEVVKGAEGKGWYTFKSRQGGIEKSVYVQKFTDSTIKKDFIVIGGYYPSVDDHAVQAVVKKAASYLRSNGKERALPEFSKRTGQFVYGSVTIFVYNAAGEILADSANPAFVGLNLSNTRDQEGRYVTKVILDQAARYPGGSWAGFALSNSYCMMYIEKVSVPDGDFIIGASYFPVTKYINIKFMVDKATLLLKNRPKEEAFARFASGDSEFLRGDISVFVMDKEGCVFVEGDDRARIWQDSKSWKDDKGRLIMDKITGIASSGGGWLEFEKNNARFRVYVKQVEKERSLGKDGKNKTFVETFIVGSGYYL